MRTFAPVRTADRHHLLTGVARAALLAVPPLAACGVALPHRAAAATDFTGTYTSTVILTDHTITGNPFTFTSTAKVVPAAGDGVYGDNSRGWTIINGGSIHSSLANGIYLNTPGFASTITNLGAGTIIGAGGIGVSIATGTVTNEAGALIYGTTAGVRGQHAGVTVDNAGTILTGSTAQDARGVYLQAGGTVINTTSGSIVGGTGVSVAGSFGYLGNHGLVSGVGFDGVVMLASGAIVNAASATIYGMRNGAAISYTGSIYNAGTMIGAQRNGLTEHNGTVINQGSAALIHGYLRGIVMGGSQTQYVANNGGVIASGTGAASLSGIYLQTTGTAIVKNRSGGLIYGHMDGIQFGGATAGPASYAYVGNAGTIRGGTKSGIYVLGSGSIANAGSTALISGGEDGILVGGSATVVNSGTVIGATRDGIHVAGAGNVFNTGTAALISGGANGISFGTGFGYVRNSGSIVGTGRDGVALQSGGNVYNAATGVVRGGYRYGIYAGTGDAVIVNFGSILGGSGTRSAGVALNAGGRVLNFFSGGLIAGGYNGVAIGGASGYVYNDGTIRGGAGPGTLGPLGGGVNLYDGGLVINNRRFGPALIEGNYYGVFVSAAASGTVINSGTILATATATPGGHPGAGIVFHGGGTVTNSNGGLVQGYGGGVIVKGGPGAVYNYGSIVATSKTAGAGVYLGAGGVVQNGYFKGGSSTAANALITGYSGLSVGGSAGHLLNGTGGTITGTGTGPATAGVLMSAGGTVTNLDHISGYSGVSIAGGSGFVDNHFFGTITATGTGAAAVGVALGAGGGTVVNYQGQIRGSAYSLKLSQSNNRVELFALGGYSGLYGDVQGGGGTNDNLVLQGYGTDHNSFLGFTGLAVNPVVGSYGSGQWVLTGQVTASNFTSISNGRLEIDGMLVSNNVVVSGVGTTGYSGNLGGVGTIVGNVTSYGILSPGKGFGGSKSAIGTLTVEDGDYTQSGGEFQVDLAHHHADQLQVLGGEGGGGTFTVGNGAVVAVDVLSNPKHFGHNNVYTIVQTNGTVEGTFGALIIEDPLPAVFVDQLVYTNEDVLLEITREFAHLQGETPNQHAVAMGLDNAGDGGGHDFRHILKDLSVLPTPEIFAALMQMSGETYADLPTVNVVVAQALSNALFEQLQLAHGLGGTGTVMAAKDVSRVQLAAADQKLAQVMGQPPGQVPMSPWSVWASGWGGGGEIDGDGNAHQLNYGMGGGSFGADYRVNPNFLVGAAFGYGHTSLSADNVPGNGDTNSYQFAGYASYAKNRWYVDGLIGYQYNQESMRRAMTFLPSAGTANGSLSSNQLVVAAEAGYAFPVMPQLTVTPFLRGELSYVDQGSFTENGSTLDLTGQDKSTVMARTILGGQLDVPFMVSARNVDLEVRAGWAHEYANASHNLGLAFASAPGSSFNIEGVRSPRDSGIVGVGLSVPVMPQASVFLRYDGQFSGTSQNHAGTAGFRYSFGAPPPAMPPVAPTPAAPVQPAAQQQTFVVFFDFDKSTLTPEGAKVVDAAVAQAQRGQATRIEVNGYTDTVGTVQYNLALSQRRAKTVHDYMVSHGIPAAEIDAQGFGKTHLRVPTADGVREAQNRRVEIVF